MWTSEKQYSRSYRIFFVFLAISLSITLLHVLLHPVRVLGLDTSIFYMDEKLTLAAYFTTVTAFLVGFIAMAGVYQAKTHVASRSTDIAFGIFFIVLSLDEHFEIHEYANTLIKAALGTGGLLSMLANLSWIFPLLLIILAVFVLFFLKMRNADLSVRKPLLAGSICFFTVLVFEIFGSATYGQDIYLYFVAAEEGLEMIGVSTFLLATLIESGQSSGIYRPADD